MSLTPKSLIARFIRGQAGLARDERGVTAIEFGLLALPFFAIIGAILETALIFIAGQVLQSAIEDSSRLVRTGQAQEARMTIAAFRNDLCGRTYGLFGDCSGIFIDLREVGNFTSATVTAPVNRSCTQNCTWTRSQRFEPGGGSAVVLAEVYVRWRTVIGLDLGFNNLGDRTRLLGGITLFRSEPFV